MAIATNTMKENLAAAYAGSAVAVSLHTADPGSTGASEVAGSRSALTWTTGAADGVATATATCPAANGTVITHVGIWSATTAGTFLDKATGAVTSTGSVAVSLTFTES